MSKRMRRSLLLALPYIAFLGCAAFAVQPPWDKPEKGEELSGGATTVFETNHRAYSLPAANMNMERRGRFATGHAFFNTNWVESPASTLARDGLGPHFIARSCTACHTNDGRAAPPEDGEQPMGLLFRLSVPGTGDHGSPRPEPTYGGQFNNQAIDGVHPEGQIEITYTEIHGKYDDGEAWTLRQPNYRLTSLAYGAMAPDTLVSPRIAQQMPGLGLLQAIPESRLVQLADEEDRNRDGISGRVNRVWDAPSGRMMVGRFGWKANVATLAHQTAGAFNGDIGITSRHFSGEECMPAQKDCQLAPRGGNPELNDQNLSAVVFYAMTLGVPARRNWTDPTVLRGKALFHQAQCAACHVPSHRTGPLAGFPELSNQQIRPYTDLLLHDMGPALADGRPDFLANGQEWRTPPLWGLGLIPVVNRHSHLLHDGRARSVSEAILWHGGEAETSRRRFTAMSRADRDALLAFIASL